VDESRQHSLESIADRVITLGVGLSDSDQAVWDSLDPGDQSHYRQRARARCHERLERQAKQNLVTFGERARRQYAAVD
jgi:hypothetical protein